MAEPVSRHALQPPFLHRAGLAWAAHLPEEAGWPSDGSDDKRRSQVWLTPKAQRLRDELLALARGITDAAEAGISADELALFRRVIARMTANLDRIKT